MFWRGMWITIASIAILSGISNLATADSVTGPMIVTVDTPTDFEAIGSLTSVDTDTPPNGVSQWFDIPNAVHWRFKIRHDQGVPPYIRRNRPGNAGGFNMVGTSLSGGGMPAPPAPVNQFGHIVNPPAAPPPHPGEMSNNIPPHVLPAGQRKFIQFGKAGKLVTLAGNLAHPPNKHHDFYQMRARVQALNGPLAAPAPPAPAPFFGPPNLLTGAVRVRAAHRIKRKISFPSEGKISSTPEAGSTVAYNAETGALSFGIGWINGLSLDNGRFGAIDKIHHKDPLLKTKWLATSIKLVEKNADGYLFGNGSFAISDQIGELHINADFDEFWISNTVSVNPLQSFAVLSKLSIVESECDCGSTFLQDFINRNLFAEGVPNEVWEHWNGLDFAFITEKDLVELTQGFTVSVSGVPATYILTANFDKELF